LKSKFSKSFKQKIPSLRRTKFHFNANFGFTVLLGFEHVVMVLCQKRARFLDPF